MAYILDPDTHAAMTSKVLHNMLISTYPSTVLQPVATLEATGLCVSTCLFHPLSIVLPVILPNERTASRDEHVVRACSLHFASRRRWNTRRYAGST